MIAGISILTMGSVPAVWAQSTTIVPNERAAFSTPAYEVTTPFRQFERTYQILISASQLGAIPVGNEITSLAFRNPSVPGPASDLVYSNYDIFLGKASVTPDAISTTFADNYAAGTRHQVRDGSLSIAANSFPTAVTPDIFGPAITFNDGGYIYTGGDLVLEIRHTASGLPDYGVESVLSQSSNRASFNSIFGTSYNALTGADTGSVAVTQFTFDVAPPPGSSQNNPIMPTPLGGGIYQFSNVGTGNWFDPSASSTFRYATTDGSRFTDISGFPVGFSSAFTVSVGNTVLGQFLPGQSLHFADFLGSGVSAFTLSGITPAVTSGDSPNFPLRLEFDHPTASFTINASAAPEPEAGWLALMGAVPIAPLLRRRR